MPPATPNDLPEGWATVTLPLAAEIIMGQSPPGSTYNESGEGLPFFQGKADFGARHPRPRKWCSAPRKVAQPGDVLISVRAPVGPTNVADQTCAIGRGLAAIRPLGGVPTEWILHAIRSQESEIAAQGTGSTFTAISRANLDQIPLPLPPLAEQKRIVAKVEALLARVNAARDRLARVPRILKRFRQSVLSSACSGKLTEDWREENGDVEPADAFLQRIQLELEAGSNAGRRRSNGRTNSSMEATEKLPATWAFTMIGRVTDNFDGMRVPVKADDRAARPGHYPYYGASGVIDTIDDYLFDGEYLLVGEDGANLLARSTPIAFQATGQFWVNNHAHVLQARGGIPLTYLEIFFNATDLQEFVTGSAQPKLTQANLNRMPVPVPPLAEQHEIVRRVDALFALADAIEKRVEAATARADRLTQSILARAFRGELVPTEASLAREEGRQYEDAGELLERIGRTPCGQSRHRRQG